MPPPFVVKAYPHFGASKTCTHDNGDQCAFATAVPFVHNSFKPYGVGTLRILRDPLATCQDPVYEPLTHVLCICSEYICSVQIFSGL